MSWQIYAEVVKFMVRAQWAWAPPYNHLYVSKLGCGEEIIQGHPELLQSVLKRIKQVPVPLVAFAGPLAREAGRRR